MKPISLLLLSLLFFINGCSLIKQPTHIGSKSYETDDLHAFITSGDSNYTYSVTENKRRFCSSRPPNFARINSDGVTLGESLASDASSAKIGINQGEKAINFGGLDPEVLITYEMMFRACELSMNLHADKETTLSIYKMFIESIQTIAPFENSSSKVTESSSSIGNSEETDDENDSDN